MKKNKIYAFLNAYSQGKSGADVIFVEIYKRLKFEKLYVVTSLLGKKFCEENGLKASYLITTMEKKFNNILITYFVRIFLGVKIILKIDNADVIYSTSDSLPDILPAFLLSLRKKKHFIGCIFHFIPKSRPISFLAQQVSLQIMKWKCKVIFVDNEGLKNDLIRKGFNRNKLVIRYPGTNFTLIKEVKAVRKYDAMSMIRIHPSKGILDLIEIWSEVVNKLPESTLGIIGTGENKYVDALLKIIRNKKLHRNVKLLGFLDDKTAFKFIKGAKVFLFPSHEEGFGMAVSEALACKVKVVAYDLPAFANTFRKMIYVVPCFDTEKFSEVLLRQLVNKNTNGSKTYNLEKFSWENAVNIERKVILS